MSDDFDPYYKWLGIAPAEQPPNHYRLLGLNLYESDPDVISSGSDRQMTHLRTFQSGPRMRECQALLNEVSSARVVLLDGQKKAAYDQLLRASVTAVEAPPSVSAVPLTPADTLLPTGVPPAAPTTAFPVSTSATTTAPVFVAKRPRRPRKHSMSIGTLVGGGVAGLVVLLVGGYGLSVALRPRPIEPQAERPANVATSPQVKTDAPADSSVMPVPGDSVAPVPKAAPPSGPTNVLVDALEEYVCSPKSQPRLVIDDSFDAAKSWRLSFSVNASPHPEGTIFCWGDSRAGMDPICIKAGPDFVDGWVMDNNSSDKATALPKLPIDWSAWHDVELVHDAVAKVIQLRVNEERQSVFVKHPPQADRPMPVHLGGLGMGALHGFPCRLREVRLEQLADPVNLPAPSTPDAESAPAVAANGKPTEMPTQTGTLGDLVNAKAANKLEVPAASELQAAREELQRFFAGDLNKERTPQEAAAFADQLIDQAVQPATQPATRYALLEIAIDLAAKGGAVASTSRAFQELDKAFSVDLAQLKADAARKLARLAKEPWEHKFVAELLEVVIDECLADDRYEIAMSLADAAVDVARKSKDSSTTARIAARSRDVKTLQVRYAPVRAALEVLAAGSDDPAANETVGRHLCLVKGKWQEGLPYLVKCDTAALRDVAARDIRKPTNPEVQAKIGEDWQNAAAQLDKPLQLQALWRAEHWCRLALAQASGLKKLPLDTRIIELGKQVGELAELPSGAVLVMTFEPSTLKRQGYVLDVSQHGYVGLVHRAILADGIAGKAFAFDGKESYIEVASTPWLSAPPAFSLAAWVNVVAWKDSAKNYVFSKESEGSRGYVLRYRDSGILDLTVGVSEWRSALSTKTVSLGEWHHVASTFDGQVAQVFVDGELDGTETVPSTIVACDAPFRIGQAAFRKERGTRGLIDEVAIFNRALAPEEVRTVYRIGRAGRPLME